MTLAIEEHVKLLQLAAYAKLYGLAGNTHPASPGAWKSPALSLHLGHRSPCTADYSAVLRCVKR